jgi:hypothetical protein
MVNLFSSLSPKRLREIGRHFRNFKYEYNDDGEMLIARARIRGDLEITAPDGLGTVKSHNLWTTEGFNHLLAVSVGSGTQYANWYIAPFSGNITVVDTLTAATFASAATELTTQYSEGTRVVYNESVPASKTTNNNASPAVITAASANVNIWGIGLLSSSAKGATSGVLLSAAKYPAVRNLPTAGDTMGVRYALTLANE